MRNEIDFGLKIKQLIEEKEETFETAAKRLKSNKSTVYRWTIQKDVSTEVLRKVCEAYNVSMSYFLNEPKTYLQKDNLINAQINAVGEKIMNYAHTGQNEGLSQQSNQDLKLLTERLKSCEEKNVLLEKMVAILEKK